MGLALGLALFFMVWWLTLFAVLPFRVRTQAEAGEVVPGTPESAPAGFPMRTIFLINTVVASIVFGFVWLAMERNWLGTQMPVEDVPVLSGPGVNKDAGK
jgi:predicted secreted protein